MKNCGRVNAQNDKFAVILVWFDCCHPDIMEHNNSNPVFINLTDNQLLDAYSTTVTGVFKNVAPAIVHINVTKNLDSKEKG